MTDYLALRASLTRRDRSSRCGIGTEPLFTTRCVAVRPEPVGAATSDEPSVSAQAVAGGDEGQAKAARAVKHDVSAFESPCRWRPDP